MNNLSFTAVAPYLSLIVSQASKKIAASDLNDLILEIWDLVKDRESVDELSYRRIDPLPHKKLKSAGFVYAVDRQPTWHCGNPDKNLMNRENHIIIVSEENKYLAFHISDTGVRNSVAANISAKTGSGVIKLLDLLPPDEVTNAFIGPGAKRLWLGGVHSRVPTKADSKTLTGNELESALDPTADQTYYLSAIRSTPNIGCLARANGRRAALGVVPEQSRVWLGPTDSWANFAETVSALLVHLSNTKKNGVKSPSIYGYLAQRVTDLNSIGKPYEFALTPYDALSEESGNDDERQIALRWAYNSYFEIVDHNRISPTIAGKPIVHEIKLKVYFDGLEIGSAIISFHLNKKARLVLNKSEFNSNGLNADIEEEAEDVLGRQNWFSLYYDSGHTVSGGAAYSTRHRDIAFDGWEFVRINKKFKFWREKPVPSLGPLNTSIGTSDSLFCMIANHWPDLMNAGAQTGWLACDDGSMEMADFIHIDTIKNKVTLIHVKGSSNKKSKRKLSTSDYEVVIGQAVKNIRYLDKNNLVEELKNGKGKKIGEAVWNDTNPGTRDDFIKVAESLGSNYSKEVVVFQPRVRKKELERASKLQLPNVDAQRKRQLDSLLLEARMAVQSLGATFRVIGEDD
ncbi:hypothetical protein [Azospirillum melinis]